MEAGHCRGECGVHPAGQGQVNFAPFQRRRSLVDGRQRGGAGRIHRHRRPLQPQDKGEPSRGHAGAGAKVEVILTVGRNYVPIFACSQANVQPGLAAPQTFRVYPRIFKCPPTGFQQYSLLRVHHAGFQGRYAEEPVIEKVQALQEPSPPQNSLRFPGIAVYAGPGPVVLSSIGNRIVAGLQQSPEGIQVRGAGEDARHTYDGNGVFACNGFGPTLPLAGFHGFRGSGRGKDPFKFPRQVSGQRSDVGIVKDCGVGYHKIPGQRPVEPVAQFHRHEGIHAQVERSRRWPPEACSA